MAGNEEPRRVRNGERFPRITARRSAGAIGRRLAKDRVASIRHMRESE